VGDPDGHNAAFAVIPAGVFAYQCGTIEDERGELEIDATVAEVPRTLPFVPTEQHRKRIRLYMRPVKITGSLTTACSRRPQGA
jgi:hypothetical protein